jgi:arginase
MPVACLCGQGPAGIDRDRWSCAGLNPRDLRQIGIRSVDAGEKRLVHDMGIEVFDMRYIDEMGMRHTMELALALVDAEHPPACEPGRGFSRPGHRARCRHHRAWRPHLPRGPAVHGDDRRHRLLASLDMVELNPALDMRNQTAELAVDLIESLFGKSTLMRA